MPIWLETKGWSQTFARYCSVSTVDYSIFITQLCRILDSDWSAAAFYGLLFLYNKPLLCIASLVEAIRSFCVKLFISLVLHQPLGVYLARMTISLYVIYYVLYLKVGSRENPTRICLCNKIVISFTFTYYHINCK